MNEKDEKSVWASFDEGFERMNEAFAHMNKAFARANNPSPSPIDSSNIKVTKTTTVHLSGKRFKTFFNLLGCAFEVLLTNETDLKIKRKINL